MFMTSSVQNKSKTLKYSRVSSKARDIITKFDHSWEKDGHTYPYNTTEENILYSPLSSVFWINDDKTNIKILKGQPFPSMGTFLSQILKYLNFCQTLTSTNPLDQMRYQPDY